MPRPSPEERKRLEANRKAKAKLRDEAAEREKRTADRVQGIVDTALGRSRAHQALPDLPELLERLEEARRLAMACSQPTAAVAAVMAEARLLGLVIDKQMVAVGGPDEFRSAESEDEVFERLRERVGSRKADRFIAFFQDMRRQENASDDNDDVIEGEARRIENGGSGDP
jgi:hypothetical protein